MNAKLILKSSRLYWLVFGLACDAAAYGLAWWTHAHVLGVTLAGLIVVAALFSPERGVSLAEMNSAALNPGLTEFVERLATQAGVPAPKVCDCASKTPICLQDGTIFVSRAALATLSQADLESAVAEQFALAQRKRPLDPQERLLIATIWTLAIIAQALFRNGIYALSAAPGIACFALLFVWSKHKYSDGLEFA